MRNNTEADSIWLVASNHDHWLPTLTGRKIVPGFKGWLWTYGINYLEQEKAVEAIWQGGSEAKNLLEKHKVDYVVIGPMEKNKEINEQWLEENSMSH